MFRLLESVAGIELSRRDRLIVYYLLGLVGLITFYTVSYNLSLWYLEGVNQSIFASFEFVVQTMTTTGYGQDSDLWTHPFMFVFVSFMQISGIGIGFFTLRLIIIPLFTGAEVNLDDRLTPKDDHVIICEYRRDSAVLLDELKILGIEYVLISSSREEAKELSDEGYSVIHGSPQEAKSFKRASIGDAKTVITDAGEANVNTILTVRTLRPDIDVIALTDDSDVRDVLLDTGADTVLSPHGVLGHHLAEKAVSSVTSELHDTVELGFDIELTEIPVHQDSDLNGVRIRESKIRERTGASIVGAWIDGELQLPPNPDTIIRPNTVLVVSGKHDQLEELSEFSRSPRGLDHHNKIIIAGLGEVGEAALSVIEREEIDTTTVDVEEKEGVDIVGDSGSRKVLQEAGVDKADSIIVGVPDDSTGFLTTVLTRSIDDDIEILIRVSDTGATRKALRAGADYVLSVPRVSARMIAKELRGEDVLGAASQIRLVRVSAEPFAGKSLGESHIYEDTGCRVIGVEDESGLKTTLDPQKEFFPEDRIILVGTDENVQNFMKKYDASVKDSVGRFS